MFEGKRVVVVTPAGRARYLSILVRYVLAARSIVDEYRLWVNTNDPCDIGYIDELTRAHDGFVRLVWPTVEPRGRLTVRNFYVDCIDPDTLYVKVDDDICFVEPSAFAALLRFRQANPRFFLVHANVVNSALMSHVHQRIGAVCDSIGLFSCEPFSPLGWKSGPAASFLHRRFLRELCGGRISRYQFERWVWDRFERASINCIAWFGRDFASFGGRVDDEDDEQWLSVDKPQQLGRPNCVCGSALVVHFAYEPQRRYLETRTKLLECYQRLAESVH